MSPGESESGRNMKKEAGEEQEKNTPDPCLLSLPTYYCVHQFNIISLYF